jgi:hypothetical protein
VTSQTKVIDSEVKARRVEIARKALRTAKWARIMTKWMITRSSKGGVKWQVVGFNGPKGQESYGIVDMIAIRKKHSRTKPEAYRGDLFEIILVQVKGGSAKFPSQAEVDRLLAVKEHHRADEVVLTEWKQGKTLCCYVVPNMTTPVPAVEVFGSMPTPDAATARTATKVLASSDGT